MTNLSARNTQFLGLSWLGFKDIKWTWAILSFFRFSVEKWSSITVCVTQETVKFNQKWLLHPILPINTYTHPR